VKPTILVVEDDRELGEALTDTLAIGGFHARLVDSASLALQAIDENPVDVVISDIQMQGMDGHALLRQIKNDRPELPVLLMTAYGTIESAVQAMREGATDYLVKPFEGEVLVSRVSQLLPVRGTVDDGVVAVDPRMREVLDLALRVAASDATVMITGESGTGKEVLFRYIHAHSARAAENPVAINCAAIPDNMLEAILFGYEKGAFTGAYKASAGKFEQAQGSTLLLDEISEMSLGLQAKLLRVLQERQVERLGGSKLMDLDVRVVATCNRDLRQEVGAGRFREDLFYRLNVFPLHMPPLRERRQDVIPLAEYLLSRAGRKGCAAPPTLSADAREKLLGHTWPGNVRELDNVVQRAAIIQRSGVITGADVLFEQAGPARIDAHTAVTETDAEGGADRLSEDLRSRERRLIIEALDEGKGSRKFAAEKLGISPRTLRYKIARMRDDGVELPCR